MTSITLILKGAFLTLGLSLGAMVIALLLGTSFGMVQSRKLRTQILGPVLVFYVFVMQGVPFYVQLLIAYFVLPEVIGVNLSPSTAGILALGLCSTAYVSEIVRGAINALPEGQWEAAQALGFSKPQALRHVILPQSFRHALPALNNELVNVVKSTALISAIGALELTKVGMNIVSRNMDPVPIYTTLAVLYLLITGSLSGATRWLEKRTAL